MGGMAEGTQESIIRTARRRIKTALTLLKSAGSGMSSFERREIAAEVRTTIVDIRKLEGTIQDPAVWQEIDTMVKGLDERLAKL
jgi:hypothetical protein